MLGVLLRTEGFFCGLIKKKKNSAGFGHQNPGSGMRNRIRIHDTAGNSQKLTTKIFQAIVTDFNVHRVLVIRADFANAQYLGVNGTKVGPSLLSGTKVGPSLFSGTKLGPSLFSGTKV